MKGRWVELLFVETCCYWEEYFYPSFEIYHDYVSFKSQRISFAIFFFDIELCDHSASVVWWIHQRTMKCRTRFEHYYFFQLKCECSLFIIVQLAPSETHWGALLIRNCRIKWEWWFKRNVMEDISISTQRLSNFTEMLSRTHRSLTENSQNSVKGEAKIFNSLTILLKMRMEFCDEGTIWKFNPSLIVFWMSYA